jgi:hypothetical protein
VERCDLLEARLAGEFCEKSGTIVARAHRLTRTR